jgi:hypothetical protein
MRIFNELVFEGYLNGTSPVYTDPQFDAMLGAAESVVLAALCDQVSGSSPTLTVRSEISADRVHWTTGTQDPEINGASITGGETATVQKNGGSATPGLAFRRFKIHLGGSSPASRVKLYVTGHAENQY